MNLAIVLLPAWRIVSFLAMLHMTANRQYKLLSELAVKLFGYTLIFVIMAALAVFSIEQDAPVPSLKTFGRRTGGLSQHWRLWATAMCTR